MKDWLETAREADYTAPGFKFAVGGELDVRLHYRTLGALAPDRRNAVLMLHGTVGISEQFLQPSVADFMFAADRPLDAGKYFIIFPDAIGHGGSSKPRRRVGNRLSALLLRRHRRRATSPCNGRPRIEAVAARSRHEHGRNAHVDVG